MGLFSDIFGGGGGGSNIWSPPGYQPTGQPQADANYQQLTGTMTGYANALPGQVVPGYQQYAGNIQNNPYAGYAMGGAGAASQYGTGSLAPAQMGASSSMFGLGGTGASYAPQMLAAGFDPQNTLYNQAYNQMLQQANAMNAMSGVSGPAAAGVLGQDALNFNTNWENQQLGREATAAQGYNSLLSGVSGAYGSGSNLGSGALNTITGATQLPYQTYLGQQNTDIGALNSLSQGVGNALAPAGNATNSLGNYLKIGQGATSLAQNAAQQNFANYQGIGSDIGSLFGGLGSLLGPSGGQGVNDFFGTGGSTWGDFMDAVPSMFGL